MSTGFTNTVQSFISVGDTKLCPWICLSCNTNGYVLYNLCICLYKQYIVKKMLNWKCLYMTQMIIKMCWANSMFFYRILRPLASYLFCVKLFLQHSQGMKLHYKYLTATLGHHIFTDKLATTSKVKCHLLPTQWFSAMEQKMTRLYVCNDTFTASFLFLKDCMDKWTFKMKCYHSLTYSCSFDFQTHMFACRLATQKQTSARMSTAPESSVLKISIGKCI